MDEKARKLIAELRAREATDSRPLIWGYLDQYNIVVPCTLADLFERCDGKDPMAEPIFIADDYVDTKYRVSTIFLVLNHGFVAPQWFETMVFNAKFESVHMRRYETYLEAEAGHAEVLAMVHGWVTDVKEATDADPSDAR